MLAADAAKKSGQSLMGLRWMAMLHRHFSNALF